MANQPSSRPSFSLRQRWSILFSVLVSIAAVSALVVMLNYLSSRYYVCFPWSVQTRTELSPRTLNVLKSVTNDVNVVIYYNKKDILFDKIKGLLNDYQNLNQKISVRSVDYLIDAGEAEKIKANYGAYMDPAVDTNLVIFSCATGTTNIVPGELLAQKVIEPVASTAGQHEFRERLKAFLGEERFTAAIYNVVNPRPVRAYFLEGLNADHHLNGQGKQDYQTFKSLLQINNVDVTNIASFQGSNGVPADCKLLVIAGPGILTPTEVENIRHYLEQGGRLFVLFNFHSLEYNTGLEPLLAKWGIAVGRNIVKDPDNYWGNSDNDVIVNTFNKSHPVVKRLPGFPLELILPRSIGINANSPGTDPSAAQELAWTGEKARLNDSPALGKPIPLMAAVEKGDVKGITDQGTTRIIVVGDSFFLDNEVIAAGLNRAFAAYAVNWLAGQSQLLQGVGPQPVTEYKLRLTPTQSQNIRWIFLAGMPGAVLLFGGLVWLRRRR
jgi:hypothetical protein